MSTAKKKSSNKSGPAAKPVAKSDWNETMKRALEKKRPAGGWPDQPKPRDSGIQKVKKNAF